MRIVPDVMVVAPVAYVLMQLPPNMPLGLMLSRGLLTLLRNLPSDPTMYQIAACQGDETLIMGFAADEYAQFLDDMDVGATDSTVIPYAELRDDPQTAYLLVGGVVDGVPHLYAICAAYGARDVAVGETVAGLKVLGAAEAMSESPERMLA